MPSLEINQGERIALLGHNGAGKSTFLKAVAGLYPLSGGKMKVEGQIRSLFDLQLGFEPDDTGRENILYRGLFLGLSPTFMRQKVEEILDFADIGSFINYPVRTSPLACKYVYLSPSQQLLGRYPFTGLSHWCRRCRLHGKSQKTDNSPHCAV